MNQRTTVSPAKIRLELHDKIYECELPWDSSFFDLLDVFVGLCSTATFGDKSKLYQVIYDKLEEQRLSDEDFERRRKENPILFKM